MYILVANTELVKLILKKLINKINAHTSKNICRYSKSSLIGSKFSKSFYREILEQNRLRSRASKSNRVTCCGLSDFLHQLELKFIITLFISMAMFCGIGGIAQYIPNIHIGYVEYFVKYIVNPTNHCCEYE